MYATIPNSLVDSLSEISFKSIIHVFDPDIYLVATVRWGYRGEQDTLLAFKELRVWEGNHLKISTKRMYMRPRWSSVQKLPSKKRGSYLLCCCEKEATEYDIYEIGLGS